MRRVALVDYGKLVLQDNCGDIKALEPGTVKIDVTACSICGSDIALYRGKRSLENERYFGHEFSGVVADPGDGAMVLRRVCAWQVSFPGPADTAGIAATGFPIIAGA